MHVLSQMVGALVEAWGEVKVQKARVILSLVGVVAAVAAMSTVIALGDLMQQSLSETQEAMEGRSITLNINVQKKAEEGAGEEGSVGGGMWMEGMPPGMYIPEGSMVGPPAKEASNSPKEDAEGRPVDPIGNAMETVAARFEIPYWARIQDDYGVEIREYLEAQNTGEFRGKPIITPPWGGYAMPEIKAVDPAYQTIFRLKTIQGRWLSDDDWQQRVAPVVINSVMWDGMGQPDINDPLVLSANDDSGRSFRVVGVVKSKSAWESPAVYVPYTAWKYMTAMQEGGEQSQPRMYVWVGEEQVEDARRMLPAAVSSVLGDQWEADVRGGEGFDLGQDMLGTVNTVIMGIGGIVIFLGALGLLNVAIVTVRQRIREIGIRRAMGASAKRVFFAVFMESVVATFVAGVIGVAIAVVILRFLPLEYMEISLQEKPAFPMSAALAGVSISTVIGALCGVIPAFAAVRVKPIDAIRY